MVSLIVPTYNRAYALIQVLDTFYQQAHLMEVIFIDDCSTDNTAEVVEIYRKKYPKVKTKYFRNEKRSGASYSRQKGVEAASSEYILFSDDDEFLEDNYSLVCLKKLQSGECDIVSGRHLYRNVGENLKEAVIRFGNGLYKSPVFGNIRFKIYTDAEFDGSVNLPFTHGIFMTSKLLLEQFKIDPYYSKGNGFREESDFQMNAFLHGKKIIMTNETHCVHMNMSEVKTGGQRVNRLKRYWFNIYYTHYFLNKYFDKIQEKLGIKYSLNTAITLYAFAEFYDFFIRPFSLIYSKMVRKT